MQNMNCRNFKEVLDSYLCDELAVETNHEVLRHAELCPPCRQEMGARRNLRSVLCGAVKSTTAPPDFRNRICERLRVEATANRASKSHQQKWTINNLFGAIALPQLAMATAAIAIVLTMVGYFFFNSQTAQAAQLSPQLWQEAAGDHEHCAAFWLSHTHSEYDPIVNADDYDPALKDLTKYSAHKALGLKFHYAHVCSENSRKFVHLIYSRSNDLISLLITDRNSQAMKDGIVPDDDGIKAGLQQELGLLGKLTVSGYQTSRHVVLIVSSLSETQNNEIAVKLAQPISHKLREIEKLAVNQK